MTVDLNPYLSFNGNAREALALYEAVFGGELTINSFGDLPMPGMEPDPATADQVMHGMLRGDNGVVLMASDTPPGMPYVAPTTSISLSGDDEATLRGYWEKLSASGSVTVPLEKAPWGDTFGMCTDGFGIPWMVNIVASA